MSDAGVSNRMDRWYDVTCGEMKVFIGLVILMGTLKKPKIEDYWSTMRVIQTPYFNEHMTRNRFQAILSQFHLADNAEYNVPVNDPTHDRLYKLRPFLDICTRRFKEVYTPGENVAVDEACIPWKGRLGYRQYNPNKPNKFHVKIFEVCDSETGYVSAFEIYTGKNHTMPRLPEGTFAHCNKTAKVVLSLLNSADLLNKGRRVYMDNFYTSVDLYENLMFLDTLACGTVNLNRKYLPKSLKRKTLNRNLKKGHTLHRRKGHLLVVRWQDKRKVTVLSSIHHATEAVAKIDFENRAVYKPTAIIDYNKLMGAVDTNDQLLDYNRVARKTIKPWKKMCFHLLDMVLTNAFILYKKYQTTSRKALVHSRYIYEVLHGLVMEGHEQDTNTIIGRRVLEVQLGEDRLNARHFPSLIKVNEGRTKRNGSRCAVCYEVSKRQNDASQLHFTVYGCKDCNKNLCIKEKRNCFQLYHTRRDYVNACLEEDV